MSATLLYGPPAISDREFAAFRDLVRRESGIYLSDAKRALLVGRLARRLRELALPSFGAYYELVAERHDANEREQMLNCICTNETAFFREPRHFEFLEETVFPSWIAAAAEGRRSRRIRIWSAACSTGEEPYSLAMSCLTHFPPGSGWDVEILATDISTRALERARAAVWPIDRAAFIPDAYLKAFMLRGVGDQEGVMKAGQQIRDVVEFRQLNLIEDSFPVTGRFDLVFCRNVLIYFDAEGKATVVRHLLEHLARHGYLFLGHAETLNGIANRPRCVIPTVYASPEE